MTRSRSDKFLPCRNVLEEAESGLTGHISVEDVTVRSDDDIDITSRRMVFISNRNLIQSEAIASQAGNTAGQTAVDGQLANIPPNNPVGKKGKGKAKASTQKAKAAAEGQSSLSSNKGQQAWVVDHSQLACDYHKGIVTGLSLIQPHLSSLSHASRSAAPTPPASSSGAQQKLHGDSQHESQQQQCNQQQQPEVTSQSAEQSQQQHSQLEAQGSGRARGRPQAMVVGLGGGALPMFLNRHCHMDVQTVELDPLVADLARRHFGFADSATLRVKLLLLCYHVVVFLHCST